MVFSQLPSPSASGRALWHSKVEKGVGESQILYMNITPLEACRPEILIQRSSLGDKKQDLIIENRCTTTTVHS